MNRFRLALAFVFMLAATVFLATFVALHAGAGPQAEAPHFVLWDVVRADGLYLSAVFLLLGLGWAYFGKMYATPPIESAQ